MAAKRIIYIKRIYDQPLKQDGLRILVDRLWPRGLKKSEAMVDEWAKDMAPTPDLRKWYNHQPERWPEFKKLYEQELNKNEDVKKFVDEHQDFDSMTLLFASKDPDYSHAQVLQKHLQRLFHI